MAIENNELVDAITKLKKLDLKEVSKKTYISVDELNAIINKEFGEFSEPKALGFVRILRRDYKLDLTEWFDEFRDWESKNNIDKSEVFVVAKESEETLFEKYKNSLISIIILIIIGGAIFVSQQDNSKLELKKNHTTIVKEAKKIVVDNTPKQKDSNTTKVEKKPAEINNSVKITKETKTQKYAQNPKEVTNENTFNIEANRRLWYGITYTKSGKKKNNIFKGRLDLDTTKDQIIILGHGYFTLVLNEQVINKKSPELFKIVYKNGLIESIRKINSPKKEEKTKKPETPKNDTVKNEDDLENYNSTAPKENEEDNIETSAENNESQSL